MDEGVRREAVNDNHYSQYHGAIIVFAVREGCGKSKWKFKMAFAMKGGGLEGVSFAIKLF